MSKRILLLFVIAIVSTVMAVGVGVAQSTVAVGTVTASQLNVRTSPFASAERITTVSQGYTSGVVGRNQNATWYQIILPGGFGWVNGSFLSVTNAHTVPVTFFETPSPNTPPSLAGGFVNTGALNIRTVPSPFNNTPITYVLRNTRLTIFARNTDNSWYKVVTANNIQGWVRSRYLTVTSGDINSLPIITENNPVPPPIVTPTIAQGVVNTGALNIRPIPSATNNVPITFIYNRTNVTITGRTGDLQWYKVSVNGIQGWARSRYINVTNGNVRDLPIAG